MLSGFELYSRWVPLCNLFFLTSFSVGSPIPVEKVENPSEQQINKLHSEYKEKLKELFEQHRDACDVPKETELVIQ